VVIYVDQDQTNNTPDGLSWATAWTNIGQGADHLAATNQLDQGGHTVLVARAVYQETSDINLTADHAGTAVKWNTFLTTNEAVWRGTRNFYTVGSGYIIIDGFRFFRNDYLLQTGTTGNDDYIIRNCLAYRTPKSAIWNYDATSITVSNCVFYGCPGIYSRKKMTIHNSIIACSGVAGVAEGHQNGEVSLKNCLLYANGFANFYDHDSAAAATKRDGMLNTADEINAISGCTNNIVGNPGFSNLGGHYTNDYWNFNEFYTNSPALKANSGYARDIGFYQDPSEVPTSTNTYYVALTGDDTVSEAVAQNPLTPWASISNAATHAIAGDTVIVQPGVYTQNVKITRGGSHNTPVTYRANGGVTLDGVAGSGTYGTLDFNGVTDVIVDGISVTSSPSHGVYVHASGAVTLRDLEVAYSSSRGILVNHGSVILEDVDVWRSLNYQGLALENAAGAVARRCRFYDNIKRGIHMYGDNSLLLENCAIYTNRWSGNGVWNKGSGIFVYAPSGAPCYIGVDNCTISGNDGNGVYIDGNNYGLGIEIRNTIISGNGIGSDAGYGLHEEDSSAGSDITVANCCFTNNASGNFRDEDSSTWNTEAEINVVSGCESNIVTDPLFVAAGSNDFHLLPGSPCRDAGTTIAGINTDLDGNRRPAVGGGTFDIGCYEWQPPPGTLIMIR